MQVIKYYETDSMSIRERRHSHGHSIAKTKQGYENSNTVDAGKQEKGFTDNNEEDR